MKHTTEQFRKVVIAGDELIKLIQRAVKRETGLALPQDASMLLADENASCDISPETNVTLEWTE